MIRLCTQCGQAHGGMCSGYTESLPRAMLLGLALVGACGRTVAIYGAMVIDNDGDGFESFEDCDDDDPEIFPGAEELPGDGVDSDCDDLDDPVGDSGDTDG